MKRLFANSSRLWKFGLRTCGSVLILLWSAGFATAAPAAHHVMLLTGQNNHNWQATTLELQKILNETELFEVTVVTTPAIGVRTEEWSRCPLNFSNYQAVVMNWNDFGVKTASDKAVMPWMDDLVHYVENGGALVAVHAASLEYQTNYPSLVGLGWHNAGFGDRLTLDDAGHVLRTPNGQGPGTGHGKPFEWVVTLRAPGHPICQGLPSAWQHVRDELWHGARGPAKNMEILATAFSPITQANEPVMWTVRSGRGRVFVTLLGHDAAAMEDDCFRCTLARGCEWATTGRVTQPAPKPAPALKSP
ncbi:MAG: ThuA domain-containing protein [Verrucomicrobiota bacterium]